MIKKILAALKRVISDFAWYCSSICMAIGCIVLAILAISSAVHLKLTIYLNSNTFLGPGYTITPLLPTGTTIAWIYFIICLVGGFGFFIRELYRCHKARKSK